MIFSKLATKKSSFDMLTACKGKLAYACVAINKIISYPFLFFIRYSIYLSNKSEYSASYTMYVIFSMIMTLLTLISTLFITAIDPSTPEAYIQLTQTQLFIIVSIYGFTCLFSQWLLSTALNWRQCVKHSQKKEHYEQMDTQSMFLGLSLLLSGAGGFVSLSFLIDIFDILPNYNFITYTVIFLLFTISMFCSSLFIVNWTKIFTFTIGRNDVSFMTVLGTLHPFLLHLPYYQNSIVSIIRDGQWTKLDKVLINQLNVTHLLSLLSFDMSEEQLLSIIRRMDKKTATQLVLAASISMNMKTAAKAINIHNIKKSWWMSRTERQWLAIFHGSLNKRIQYANLLIKNIIKENNKTATLKDIEFDKHMQSSYDTVLYAANLTPLELLPHVEPTHAQYVMSRI